MEPGYVTVIPRHVETARRPEWLWRQHGRSMESGMKLRDPRRWAAWTVGLAMIAGALAAVSSAASVPGAAGPFVYVADEADR